MSLGWDILYGAAGLISSPFWGYKLLRTGKWRTDWPGRFGRGETLPPLDAAQPRQRLLIHGVSVGEINAIRSLVDMLHQRCGDALEIVICTTTDTGWKRARELFEPPDRVVRYPLDFGRFANRFLDRIRPTAVALVELEIWPNFVAGCRRRSIPVCVINGRLSARSYRWYRLGKPLVRKSFASLSAAGVQTADYAVRFQALGAPAERVHVLDTMKWDTAKLLDAVPGATELAKAMGIGPFDLAGRPLIVAGSTAPGEEELLIRTCPKDAQLLLVPRKPERFDQVAALDPAIIRRTRCPDGTAREPDNNRVFLLDTMGELTKAYSLASVALVGRSFLGLYGSDPIEPIALARPTIIGPCYSDFHDTVQAFLAGEGIRVSDRPGAEAARLLADPAAAKRLGENGRRVIFEHQGATQRHVDMILKMMADAKGESIGVQAPG